MVPIDKCQSFKTHFCVATHFIDNSAVFFKGDSVYLFTSVYLFCSLRWTCNSNDKFEFKLE